MARRAVKVDPMWQCKHCGTMDLKKKRAGFMNTKVCKDCLRVVMEVTRRRKVKTDPT